MFHKSHLDGRTVTVPSDKPGHNDHHVGIVQATRFGAAGPAGVLYLVCDCAAGAGNGAPGSMFFRNLARGRYAPCYAMRFVANLYAITMPRRDYRGIGR